MFTIANRLRGTYGWFASIFGIVITIVMYLLTKDLTVALLIGVGYWFGEIKKKQLHKWVLSYAGGWEWQEGFYGLMQYLVLIGLGVSYVMAH